MSPQKKHSGPHLNALAHAATWLDRASLAHLRALSADERRRLRGLCEHWAQLCNDSLFTHQTRNENERTNANGAD